MNALRIAILLACLHVAASRFAQAAQRVPVVDCTDLYHPHQDVGDNLDLIAAYALPDLYLSFSPPGPTGKDGTP